MRIIIISAAVFLIMIMVPGITQAADASVELNVNDSDVQARLDVTVNPSQTPLTVGAEFLYSDDDDFWLSNLNLAIKDEVFATGLNLGLGFEGIFGETDIVDKDLTTLALAFLFLAEYDFRETGAKLPVSLIARLGWAPDILSFDDTEGYFEFYTAVYLHINFWASIFVGYRDIEIEYENGSKDQKLDHDSFYIGARISF